MLPPKMVSRCFASLEGRIRERAWLLILQLPFLHEHFDHLSAGECPVPKLSPCKKLGVEFPFLLRESNPELRCRFTLLPEGNRPSGNWCSAGYALSLFPWIIPQQVDRITRNVLLIHQSSSPFPALTPPLISLQLKVTIALNFFASYTDTTPLLYSFLRRSPVQPPLSLRISSWRGFVHVFLISSAYSETELIH